MARIILKDNNITVVETMIQVATMILNGNTFIPVTETYTQPNDLFDTQKESKTIHYTTYINVDYIQQIYE